jgi:diacylglycerol kinase family enzyme
MLRYLQKLMRRRARAHRSAVLIASPRVQHDAPAIARIRELFQQRGIALTQTYAVADLDGTPPLAKRWQAQGVELVIAAGGDGTMGCAATHVAQSSLPLGVLPLGTSNDFARSLRLPLDLEGACQTIAQGQPLAIDLGSAEPADAAPHALESSSAAASGASAGPAAKMPRAFFTHALTLGLNVAFARLATDAAMRERFGALTYPVAALGTLQTFEPMDFTLTFHGAARPLEPDGSGEDALEPERPYPFQALQVAVVNTPVFGGRLEFSLAGVALDDHLLDIVIVERFDAGQLVSGAIAALAPLVEGRREARSSAFPGIRHIKAQSVTIATAQPADVTLDGELRGRTPIHVVSAARALHVLVPAAHLLPAGPSPESSSTLSGR